MKRALRLIVVAIFLFTIFPIITTQTTKSMASGGRTTGPGRASNATAVTYDIATWEGFRTAAVSYTFDDNCPNQLAIAVPMFDQFGFKLTLFTVTSSSWGWQANWSGLQNAANEGHEIASHTIDHQPLGGMTDAQQQAELQISRDTINARVRGQACLTFAYPNCILGNSTLVAQYYFAARGCSGQIVSSTPGDFMNVSSFVCGNQGLNTSSNMEAKANSAASSHGWCVYLMHGINDGAEPGAYSPISQDTIRATLQYFAARQDQFWVAPFGTVARYIQERNSGNAFDLSVRNDTITARVLDVIPDTLPRVPLTLRRPLPAGWDSVVVRQDKMKMSSKVVKVDTTTYVIFDAIPNGGDVTIINAADSRVGVRGETSTPRGFGLLQNYPNPFNPTTTIQFSTPQLSDISLKVFDSLGREAASLMNEQRAAGNYTVQWDAHSYPSGVYFCRLRAGSFVDTKKLVLVK